MVRRDHSPARRLAGRSPSRLTAGLVALLTALATLAGTAQARAADTGVPKNAPNGHYHRQRLLHSPVHSTRPGTPGGQLTGAQPTFRPPGQQPPTSSRSPLGRAPITGPDLITVDECRGQDAAFQGQGWGKSRFASCQAENLTVLNEDCFLFICETVGTATVEITDIQYTRNALREADVVQVFNNWQLDGDIAELPLSADVTCKAADGFGPCTVVDGFGGPNIETVGQWAAEGSVTSRYYSFSQPDSAGVSPSQISYAALSWHFALIGGKPGADHADGPDSRFRCDAAPYLVNTYAGEGCVFPWVTETVRFYASDTPESAAHIITAQFHPDQTEPPRVGKVIPGAPGTAPLHRTADGTLIDAHRATAVNACNTYFPGYAAHGLDCDEYPFASTVEGADDNLQNYSVDPIDDSDNRSAGGILGAFYTGRRILGADETNDPFYVTVAP